MKKTLLIGFLLNFGFAIGFSQTDNEYLEKVLHNLEQIESARYFSTSSSSAPGDTTAFRTFGDYVFEFTNTVDTFIGAGYIRMDINDTTKIKYIYDGNITARFDWDAETIVIDNFEGYPKGRQRPVMSPFFNNIKSILNYALESNDSLELFQHDYGDSLKFTLKVFDKIVEFNGKPVVYNCRTNPSKGKISQYDIWILKCTDLPYRMRRKMPHQTSFESCSDVIISKVGSQQIIAERYFPTNFSISDRKNQKITTTELEGKKAPDWILKDIKGNDVALKKLDSKILLIQFTGVGCGPCHASIPFLKQLVIDNENNDFEFISIESWSTNIEGLKRYCDKNEFNYKFLVSNKDLTKSYNVMAVPAFFLLDKDRIIQKVIMGYKKGETDEEIRKAINELL